MATKLRGQKVMEVDGIHIIVNRKPSKTGAGRDRLWISLRQPEGAKPWRVGSTLAYSQAVDIRFERRSTLRSEGRGGRESP